MSEPERSVGQGQCLCGQVKVMASTLNPAIGACHCQMCRQWGGGPLLALECGTDVTFEGEENITVFSSSDWAERGFCRHCGTHLFYRLKQNHQYYMPAGLFSSQDGFQFEHQVFIDEKPPYYSFANATHNMTGAEVFAQFSS
ncbi:MAG TPA: GFA family protein [Stenomitos sp.]